MNKKITYLITFLILFSIMVFSDIVSKVMVTNTLANIRTKPGLDGEIIKTAQKGDSFILLEREGAWYKITLAIDRKGDPEFGYIHSSISIIVSEDSGNGFSSSIETPGSIEPEIKNKSTQPSPVSMKKPHEGNHQEKLFSGSYFKGGIMTSPKVEGFSDKWIASWGFDKSIGKYMTWGLEFQPYYRSISDDAYNISIMNVSTNIFLNFKGGINIGQFVRSLKLITLYGGVGIGTNLSFTRIEYDGSEGNQFDQYLAWHIILGTELKLGGMDIIIEIQKNKVINSDIEPSTQSYNFILFGIRF